MVLKCEGVKIPLATLIDLRLHLNTKQFVKSSTDRI